MLGPRTQFYGKLGHIVIKTEFLQIHSNSHHDFCAFISFDTDSTCQDLIKRGVVIIWILDVHLASYLFAFGTVRSDDWQLV